MLDLGASCLLVALPPNLGLLSAISRRNKIWDRPPQGNVTRSAVGGQRLHPNFPRMIRSCGGTAWEEPWLFEKMGCRRN